MKRLANQKSQDALFDGRLHCIQHQHGYRFSIDAVLLGHFISPLPNQTILDLGAGCGIISLILAYRCPKVHLTAFEIQKPLLSLINKNIVLNNFQQQIEVVEGDFCQIPDTVEAGSYDWLVCNPPYRKRGSGRVNPKNEQALARHELQGELADAVKAAAYALKNKGRAAFIYPASRGASLISSLKSQRLEPKRVQIVYSYPGTLGKFLLVETVKNGGEELEILPPFYIYKEPGGEYTKEMDACYAA